MAISGIYDENNRRVIAMLRSEPSLLEQAAEKLHSERPGTSRRFIRIGQFSGPEGNQLYVGLKIPSSRHIHEVKTVARIFSLELAIFEYFSETHGYHAPRFMVRFSSQNAHAVLMEDLTEGGQKSLSEIGNPYEVPFITEILNVNVDEEDLLRCCANVHGEIIEGEGSEYLHTALIDFDHLMFKLKDPYNTQLTERAQKFLSDDYLIRA